jgi:hypothetical protein
MEWRNAHGQPEHKEFAVEYVLQLERAAGRQPQDRRKTGDPVDIVSPPRLIEVKGCGRSARGQPVPLEHRQVDALHANRDRFFLYVVEHINDAQANLSEPTVLVLDGPRVLLMVASTTRTTTRRSSTRTFPGLRTSSPTSH